MSNPLVQKIANWLYRQALISADIDKTVGEFGEKLLAGGIPVLRINVGAMLMHPVMGAMDITWDAKTGNVISQAVPKTFVSSPDFRNAPFYQMALENVRLERFDLTNKGVRNKYDILEKLAGTGVTDYLAFHETFGQNRQLDWANLPSSAEGSYISYSTKRHGGFEESEIEKLRELSLPFSLALKVAVDKMLTMTLLETYLGKTSGRNVYSGTTARGDGENIDCILWYSDLRNSTSLAASMDLTQYLSLINEYYNCTAGSVLDHGGEVLKFIGDGLLAIFPYDEETRPIHDMANTAVLCAKDSLLRNVANNKARADLGLDQLKYGIGLHVGKVMYGNVGTEQRLDMTVTGPAVNEVTRYESLTKELETQVIASSEFKDCYCGSLMSLGSKELKGLSEPREVFTHSQFAK